ncbi:ORF13 [Aviadenovirus cerasi]|uniref:ORF13 n=1 Tax=Fowl aviadenovirus 5 TaxID=172861 RepID=A0A6M3Z566_9ADEN|nr:ORF13 [Fowl aviadenovirus 5]
MATKRKATSYSLSLLAAPSQKRRTEATTKQHDFSGFPYVPETPPTPSEQKDRYSQTNRSASQMDALIERLFRDGIAHRSQWDQMPYDQHHQTDDEKEYVLGALRERFGNYRTLYAQLPHEDPDSLKLAFYNARENWFHQLLEKEGYDAEVCAITIRRWLRGDINTLVLCGGRLSNAKLLFNALVSCFPIAISDGELNDLDRLAEIAPHASLYCVPFVEEQPYTLMLHFMEGNAATCYINKKTVHIPSTPMLIHCTNPAIADAFICRNASILFLDGCHSQVPPCYSPRQELKDYVSSAGLESEACATSVHCKREWRHCVTCQKISPEF